jgi:hypothetical protein
MIFDLLEPSPEGWGGLFYALWELGKLARKFSTALWWSGESGPLTSQSITSGTFHRILVDPGILTQ